MVYVRTQSATELLGNVCSLYGRHFLRLIAAFALIGFPTLLIENYLVVSGSTPLTVAGFAIGLMGMVLAYGALITVVSEICVGVLPNLPRAYRRMFRYSVPLLIASLLQVLAIIVGMLLLIVPGIVAVVFLMFVTPVIVLERKTAIAAIGRSCQLARQFFWRNLGLLAVGAVVSGIIGGILGGVVGFVGGLLQLEPRTFVLLFGSFNAMLYSLIIPVSLLLNVLMYYDLRARKEGYDPTQLTQELQV
jgi:hypothetical protein